MKNTSKGSAKAIWSLTIFSHRRLTLTNTYCKTVISSNKSVKQEKPMEHIAKLSRWMRLACLIISVIVVAGEIATWIFFETMAPLSGTLAEIPYQVEHMSWRNLIGGFLISGALTAILVYGLYRLWLLFGFYSRGQIFSRQAAEQLHRFARVLLLYAVLIIPAQSLLVLVLTISNPVGEREISIGISDFHISNLVLGVSLLIISWVMREAARVAEDNARIV
jgi:hypothetical protein